MADCRRTTSTHQMLIGQKFLISRVLVSIHETLLRDLYNILQCVFDPKPMNPKPILVILDQYIYSNPIFAETNPDLTKEISDLEIGLKVIAAGTNLTSESCLGNISRPPREIL